jgi:hypothetical protein
MVKKSRKESKTARMKDKERKHKGRKKEIINFQFKRGHYLT